VIKGSLTATSSTSSLRRAILATKRPILPNPIHILFYLMFNKLMHVKKKSKHVGKMKKNTVDTDLNLLVGCCCVKEKKKLNPEKMKIKIKTT
jgi:hypothetical protein